MLSRLETMVLSAAPLPIEVIRSQIASAIDIMVQPVTMRDRSRRVLEITEVIGVAEGQVILNPLFRYVKKDKMRRTSGSGSWNRPAIV